MSALLTWLVIGFAVLLYLAGILIFRALAVPSGFRTRPAVVAGLSQEPWVGASLLRRWTFTLLGPIGAYVATSIVLALGAYGGGEQGVDESRIEVVPDQPAEKAGLRTGDRIVSVAGRPYGGDFAEMRGTFEAHRNDPVSFVVERAEGAERPRTRVEVVVTPNERGRIGVTPLVTRRPMSIGAALADGFSQPVRMWAAVVRHGSTPSAPVELAGPVGIVRSVAQATESSWTKGLRVAGLLLANFLWAPLVACLVMFPRRKPPCRPTRTTNEQTRPREP